MRIRLSRLHPFVDYMGGIFYVCSKFESNMLLFEPAPICLYICRIYDMNISIAVLDSKPVICVYVCVYVCMYVHIIAIIWSLTNFLWPRPTAYLRKPSSGSSRQQT